MLHIVTQTFKTEDWISLQQRYLEKYTKEEFTVWLGYTERPKTPLPDNYKLVDLSHTKDSHFLQANYTVNDVVLPQLEDDDVFIFLDIDAFPCDYGWEAKVLGHLKEHEVAAMFRYEDLGYYQEQKHYPCPHLAFFATTKKVWIEKKLNWELRPGYQNPQFGMQDCLVENSVKVKQMIRTNKFNVHNIMFGVYDDIIYHQCCAVRGLMTQNPYEGFDLLGRSDIIGPHPWEVEEQIADVIALNGEIWTSVYNSIVKDKECNFVKRFFLGKP